MNKINLLALVVIFITSCAKTDDDTLKSAETNEFVGVWVDPQFNDTAYVASLGDSFIEDKAGLKFNSDGTFTHRSNSGWCGTPPISYSNYDGSWTKFPDNTLFIETEYWGGATSYTIEILKVSNNKLVYRYLDANN